MKEKLAERPYREKDTDEQTTGDETTVEKYFL